MLRRLTLVSVLVALLTPAVADAHKMRASRHTTLEQKGTYLERVLRHDTRVLRYFRDVRPLDELVCPLPWVQRWSQMLGASTQCVTPDERAALRYRLRFHVRQSRAASKDLRYVRHAILNRSDRTWGDGVAYADRVFPGSGSWLRDVSGSEGGGGLWTWNGHGNVISEATRARYRELERHYGVDYLLRFRPAGAASDVGGWLQFMPGTFYGYVDDAFGAARARGFRVLPEWRSWLSPAGQALTGGYMRWSGRSGGHWSASGH
jgi:hypothetical protein